MTTGLKRLRVMERYLFVVPAILLVSMIVIYPLISNLVNSMQTDQRLLLNETKPSFVGFDNYKKAWSEGLLQLSLKNSFSFTALSVFIAFILGLIASAILNSIKKMSGFYRILIVLPWLISPMVAAFAWKALFNDSFGMVNFLLMRTGVIADKVIWLGHYQTAFAALIIANVWRIFPFATIMLLAGLQSVPEDIIEAAEIDGAGPVAKYFLIILPQLKNIIIIVILLQFIWNFNEFTVIQILTQGGPADTTIVMPVLIHKLGFKYWRTGTASSLSLMLSVILLFFSTLYLKILRKK
jgi:multiple sugar transport system permease protein